MFFQIAKRLFEGREEIIKFIQYIFTYAMEMAVRTVNQRLMFKVQKPVEVWFPVHSSITVYYLYLEVSILVKIFGFCLVA
jgi:hypothetical protein